MKYESNASRVLSNSCQQPGLVHAADCGCHRADEFLRVPTAVYNESRRDFLRKAVLGGALVAALPMIAAEEARADIFRPSQSDQQKQGDAAAAQVLQKYHEINDSRAESVRRAGAKLIDALTQKDRGPWNYRFHLIDSKEVNAFALPGGSLFFFTGLVDRIQSNDELAAVMGHEITHVRREHWARQVASQTKQQLGIGLILGATHAGRGWQSVAGGLEGLYSLKLSRGDEDEADAKGLDDMVRAGYNPNGMLDLFNTLLKATGGKESGPGFLSDHPLTKDRIKKTEQRIARLKRNQN